MLKVEGVTHWSLPVNDLEESVAFYRDVLGLEYKGNLPSGNMACFVVDGQNILLAQRNEPTIRTREQDGSLHHSFTVSPEVLEEACALFMETGVPIRQLFYRERGYFLGRELYFQDPSGNELELRDPTWTAGMPTPTYQEIAERVRQRTGVA